MSMTAQAGAVAAAERDARTIYDIACIREARSDATREDVDFKAIALRNWQHVTAAVPVEALEGLVEAVRSVVSMPLEEFLAFDNTPGNKRIFGANDWNLAVGNIRRLRAALANTERLIKERSNG